MKGSLRAVARIQGLFRNWVFNQYRGNLNEPKRAIRDREWAEVGLNSGQLWRDSKSGICGQLWVNQALERVVD